MVTSNKVFPFVEQPSPDPLSPSPRLPADEPAKLELPRSAVPSDTPPASARAALDNEDDSEQSNASASPSPLPPCCFVESTDSYSRDEKSSEASEITAVTGFSPEPEEPDEAGECDPTAVDQGAACARRVSHAPSPTLLGPPRAADTTAASDLQLPMEASRFQGFLEALGVIRSGASESDPGAPARAQSFSVATSAASAAFVRATSKLHELALGDNHDVQDRWDDFDDENPDRSPSRRGSQSGSRRSSATEQSRKPPRRGSSVSVASTEGNCSSGPNAEDPPEPSKMALPAALRSTDPTGSVESEDGETYEEVNAAGKPTAPGPGFVYEHATVKVLLWYYMQTLIYSAIVGAISLPLVTIFSSFSWHTTIEVPEDQVGIVAPIQPNHPVFQWMMLFWIANPLTLYCPLLLACIKRSIRLPWQMYSICTFTLAWGAILCTIFYIFDVPYWLWYLDLFIVLAAYVPCMCVVGWFIDEDAGWQDRLWDIAFTATLETVVATSTLLYCWFLMPLFFALQASWQKLVWLCVIHPIYYELTTGFIVRKALHRNSALGRTNIMYFLTIVHGMAHQVSITTMLQASVEPTRILAVTVVAYNISKLFWRSTVIHRHLLFDRLLKGWSKFTFSEEERTELARMVSVHVLTEVVLENASIMVTPYLMYRMYNEPLFMMVVPKTFHAANGTYPANTMITMIFVMLSITIFFDVLFWLLNYHVLQFLPLINTWRRIKKARLWYLTFLINAFIFMGVLFLFLIMMMLPRGTYCTGNDYCKCTTSAYESLCRGELFAVHHDYLVDIDPSLYI